MPSRLRVVLTALSIVITALVPLNRASAACACSQPGVWAVDGAFEFTANGLQTDPALQPASTSGVHSVPSSILKAVGWVESGWRQFTPQGKPVVSFDFGYGIMQITSGMAGAFGSPDGSIDPATQSDIASNFRFNIGYGALILEQKWSATPRIGNGDPTVIENWYYALWAYNGWGWVNNPNNPRFSRQGTPATDPNTYPYQERVLYLVAHPPEDSDGNPLWRPIPLWMPSKSLIGQSPRSYTPGKQHRQPPAPYAATFTLPELHNLAPGGEENVTVHVLNTGTQAWAAAGSSAIALTYHLFTSKGDPWGTFSPFSPGVVALGQGTVALPHNVLPGHAVHLDERVQAPANVGDFLVVWDLQEAPSTWLSQEGLLPRASPLHVIASRHLIPGVSPTPTKTPLPGDASLFIADTSFPDGASVDRGQSFIKSWLVFNSGSTTWTSRWTLHHISGPSFGVNNAALPLVVACQTVNLAVRMKAPSKPGSYVGVWRMQDAAHHQFGDKLTVDVTVNGPRPTGTPSPSPEPTNTAVNPTETPTSTPVG